MLKYLIITILNILVICIAQKTLKPDMKRDNPSFIRDRFRIIAKPEMPPLYHEQYKGLYHPAWMDYCDPYHCNDYWKQVCGLNRRKMRFRYFQSTCHLILNNQCSTYRGSLKYDLISLEHCAKYLMFLRSYCPYNCDDEPVSPVCAVSMTRGHTVLFMNQCSLQLANCKNLTLQEYEETDVNFCEYQLQLPEK